MDVSHETTLSAIRNSALSALRPPAKVSLSEWTESNIVLPASLSAQPGPMRLFRHQVAIADSIGDPNVERVSILKSARIGYTQLLCAAMANYVENDPAPILVVIPAEADARALVVRTIDPSFEASGIVLSAHNRDVMLERHFPGGSLKLVSAKSPRNLRALTARVLLMDEVDAWDENVGGEGDALALAEKRTLTFANRKIVCGSTPVHEATSKICAAYDRSDQRVFEVPCPHCGEPFEVLWKHVQWDEGKPETAYCVCPSNGCVIEESDKAKMVNAGDWRVTRPNVQNHHGYRINSLVSLLPNARWGILAAEFLEAKKSPETLQVFTNTVLGEPWRDQLGDGIEASSLQSQAQDFSLDAIPTDIELLTMGVDVQEDRLAIVVLGFNSEQSKCCVLHHKETWGSPYEDDVWRDLDALQKRLFKREDGQLLKLGAVGIDAGSGSHMDTVLAYCRPRSRTFATKGAGGFQRPIVTASKTRGGQLQILGVDSIKKQLFDRLTAQAPSILFSDTLPGQFYEELTSERLVVKFSRGAPIRQWQRIPGRRAESLDAMGYAWAVRHLVGRTSRVEESLGRKRVGSIPSNWVKRPHR